MASLIENVNRINADKKNIRQAIISKGVDVSASESLDNYASKISEISSIDDSTVFKPHPNFIELKDYYRLRLNDGVFSLEKITIPEDKKFRCIYNDMLSSLEPYNCTKSNTYSIYNGFNDLTFSTTKGYSKECIDNSFPKFHGHYVTLTYSTSDYKRCLTVVDFEFDSSYITEFSQSNTISVDGYTVDKTGKCSNGVQFFNKMKALQTSSGNVSSLSNTTRGYHCIIKITDDVGVVVYRTISDTTGYVTAEYSRKFKVTKDGTITIFSAGTVTGAETSSTWRNTYFAASTHAPNQFLVYVNTYTVSSGKSTYSYKLYSYSTTSSDTSGLGYTAVQTTDSSGASVNYSVGDSTTYSGLDLGLSSNTHSCRFSSDLGVFAMMKKSDGSITMYTYFGDNRSSPAKAASLSYSDKTFVLPFNFKLDGNSSSYTRNGDGPIIGRDIDGNFVIRESSTGIIRKIKFDITDKLFYYM